jgi:heptosyltransferase-2
LGQDYKTWFYSKHTEGSEGLQIFIAKAPIFGNKLNWPKTLTHETAYYMELVRGLGYTGPTPPQSCPMSGVDFDDGDNDSGIVVALCNGASGSQKKQKQWPHFAKLSRVLKFYYGACIVTVGNGNELKGVSCDVDFVGKLKITQTARVLKDVDLFITSDTGLMHIADALHVPTVVIFGGTILSKNGPCNGTSTIARAGLPCQPCQYTNRFLSCEENKCLRDLTVGEVFAHIRKRLSNAS